jgi:hypothetical protein
MKTPLGLALVLASLALAARADDPSDTLPMKARSPKAEAAASADASTARSPSALPDGRALLRAHVEACGGASALRGVDNAVITTKYAIAAQSMSGDVTMAFARPDRMRSTCDLGELGRIEQGYDGATGWEINPMTGPRLLEARELEQLKSAETNIFNLANMDRLYQKAETLGAKPFAGAEAWEVRLIGSGGRETIAYFDRASGLITGLKTTVSSQVGEIPATITLSDYKAFSGPGGKLLLPTRSTQSVLEGMIEAVTTIENVELNVPADRLPSFAPPPEIEALRDQASP